VTPDTLPTWLRQVSDDDVRRQVGLGAFSRGVAYLSQDAVRSLETGDNGRMLLATVQGSGASTYQTLVIADPQLPEHPVTWSGRCSCPMQADCKHVVAVLLKARQQLAASERAAVPAWEATLAELVRDVRELDRVPLGLQVEVQAIPGPGKVRSTRPGAGEPVRRGSTVTLFVF